MSVKAGPQLTITPGGSVMVSPVDAGAIGTGALVLDNLSTFLLQVAVGPDLFWQPPLTRVAYDYTEASTPANVSAVQLPGDSNTSGLIAPSWASTDQKPDPSTLPPVGLAIPANIVAQAIFAAGVPNVLTETVIFNATIAANGTSGDLDVSKFASLYVYSSTNGAGGAQVAGHTYITWDVAGSQYNNVEQIGDTGEIIIPVTFNRIRFAASTTNGQNLLVIGSNRHAPTPKAAGHFNDCSNQPTHLQLASTTMALNIQYLLSNLTCGNIPVGRCWMMAKLATGTAARGILNLRYDAVASNRTVTSESLSITDTAEWHTEPGGDLFIYKEVILPPIPLLDSGNFAGAPMSLLFQCRVVGTTSVDVFFIPA